MTSLLYCDGGVLGKNPSQAGGTWAWCLVGEDAPVRKVLVFGSNRQGRHGKGAALEARRKWGAVYGRADGPQGDAYAIVTKELRSGYPPVTLAEVARGVACFLEYVGRHGGTEFLVTPIGCGLAGFSPPQIAPLFEDAPENTTLPEEFLEVLGREPPKRKQKILDNDRGVVTPADLGRKVVTNNDTEFLAALLALEAMPGGWEGVLHTDSNVTKCRIASMRSGAVPADWHGRMLEAKKTRKFIVVLVGGHPTKKELAAGFRARNGFPVDPWNVWCDEQCQALAAKYKAAVRRGGGWMGRGVVILGEGDHS